MGDRSTKPLPGGLMIPERCTAAALEPVGAGDSGSTDSSYTQAGPRPGLPVASDSLSRLRLEISGAQSVDIDAQVIKAGSPARDGVQVALKAQTEAATEWLGWDGPQLVTGFTPIDWNNTSVLAGVTTFQTSQRVLVGYQASGICEFARFDTDEAVTLITATGVTNGDNWNDPALVTLPGSPERALVFYGGNTWYSDDEGDTWALYAANITTEDTTNYDRTTAVVYRGDIALFVEDGVTANTVHHLVSTDLGATFRLVKSYSALGGSVNAVANEDGIHLAFHNTSSQISFYRRLGTAFDEVDAVTPLTVASGASHARSTIVSDGTGILYYLSGDTEMWIYESRDSGESFTISDSSSIRWGDNADNLSFLRSTYSLGRFALVAGFVNNGTPNANRLGLIWMGGWNNAPVYVDSTASALSLNRWGFGVRVPSSFADGETWFPFALPSGQGWTAAGGGTDALNAEGSYQCTTTANARTNTITLTSDAELLRWRMYVASTDGDLSTDNVAIQVRIADGVDDYDVSVRFTDTQFAIYDNNAAALLVTATSLPATGTFTEWRLWMDQGNLKVAYGVVGDTTLTVAYDGTTTNDNVTPNATSLIAFGNLASGTSDSRWREVHYCGSTTEKPALSTSLDTRVGKSLNARREPVPDFGETDKVMWIKAVAGPGRRADAQTVDVFYEHAIQQAHAEVSPSPRATWRSTDTSEQRIVYDLGATGWTGHSVGLFVHRANFRTAILESYNGATWDTVATLDLADGFTGLAYTLDGDMMYPDTATTNNADRYLWEQELSTGWVLGDDGGGGRAATRVVSQSQGGWTQDTTVIPMLRLDDPTAISALVGATVSLVWGTGLIVVHHTAIGSGLKRYWRVRIPSGTAGSDTPVGEDYYEAGVISVCRIQPFGAEVEWGWSDRGQLNVQQRKDSSGTLRVRERGDPNYDWSISWPNAEHWRQLRIGPSVDYQGVSGGLGLAGKEDISQAIRGYITLLSSGETPVVGVEPFPETSGTIITDPTRFRYGRLVNTASRARATGDTSGQDEDNRVEAFRLEEIV